MPRARIIDAVRSPIGKLGGALAGVRPDDLGALALKAVLDRSGILAADVEDIYMGCANQAGETTARVAARQILFDDTADEGTPEAVPAFVALLPDPLELVEIILDQGKQDRGARVTGAIDSLSWAWHTCLTGG